MSNSAWCDSNSKGDKLNSHSLCPNPKCNCQKQINFTPKQYQLEVAGLKEIAKSFRGTQSAWNKMI